MGVSLISWFFSLSFFMKSTRYLKTQTLAPIEELLAELCFDDGSTLLLLPEDYMLGLADMTGELVRMVCVCVCVCVCVWFIFMDMFAYCSTFHNKRSVTEVTINLYWDVFKNSEEGWVDKKENLSDRCVNILYLASLNSFSYLWSLSLSLSLSLYLSISFFFFHFLFHSHSPLFLLFLVLSLSFSPPFPTLSLN